MFAAITSLLAYWTMRRSLLDSARPEIVIENWDRRAGGERDVAQDKITFRTIRNDGPGSAYHLYIVATDPQGNPPTVITSITRIPILARNEEREINGEIDLMWGNVASKVSDQKYLSFPVEIFCWDSKGRRHKTTYRLMVYESLQMGGESEEFAPGVSLISRTTVTKPNWLLKLIRKWNEFSGFLNKVRHWKPSSGNK